MAKVRIHEIAKELNISSKDIVTFLTGKGVDVKNHMSSIEDQAVDMVKKHFGKGEVAPKTEQKPEPAKKEETTAKEEPKKAEAAPAEQSAEAAKDHPKKKSSITAVFNPQNSKMNKGRNNNNYRNQNNNRPNGERYNRRSNDSSEQSSLRPGYERISSPQQLKNRAPQNRKPETASAQTTPQQEQPTQNTASAQTTQNAQPNRPRVQEFKPQTNADGKTRNVYAERRAQQESRPRPAQDGNRRPQGDNRNARPQGGGYNRPQGQGNRNETNNNRNFANNRGPAGNTQGDRNNNRFTQNRPNQARPTGGRLDQELTKFNQNASKSTPEEGKARETRERDVKKTKKNFDAPKKQERYVNLEKHGGKKKNKQPQQQPKEKEDVIKTIVLPDTMTIKELADKMKVVPSVIVKKLFLQGTMVTVNQEIDFDKAEEIALEYNCICEHEIKVDVIEELLKEDEEDESLMISRAPVVCVMGHVDHGKTSLLDAIRETRVTDREAGGITQHIGASVVSKNGQNITFLDTPGHEAFTAMRMRGANSTDIAILVVAADDGVMPQTIEAINHAKAAEIEIIVAINKIDKPSANVEKVKQELSEYELIPEDWGGSTVFVPVSAHTGEGIDQLLEMILLTAEILELKANPKRNARGLVIEGQLDKGRGAVATVLVQKGTLRVGEPIAAGSCYGKVRAMIDDKGRRVKEAGPSTPVEILGLNSVPNAGEIFVATDSEKEARSFAETFVSQGKEKLLEDTKSRMSLDDLYSQIQAGNLKELAVIVKADVQGSVEAVKQSLEKLSNEEVVVKVIHGGVGAINESDIILASASNAIIIGFNVRPDQTAKATADREGVDVRLYKVIYNAIEDIEAAMKGMLDPVFEEKVIGHAEIRQIFKASGIGNIAGSYVLDGTFERGCKVRISREGTQIFEGDLASLKRFKDDVKEVKSGFECGFVFEGFNEFNELDIVEGYKMVEVPR